MIHIHNSCRNINHNLKLLQSSRQICLGISNKCKNKDKEPEPANKKPKNDDADSKKKEYPEEPTTCCMSGCANCVWLEYAEKLSEYYKDGGEQAIKEINEKVTDPNIKAFLLHELRMRNIK